jgi:hypothetical protein
MKRRTFIISTAVVGTAVGATILFKWKKGLEWKEHPLLYPLILSGFCDEKTIRNIGLSYRTLVPNENSKDKLLTLLTNGMSSKQFKSSDYPLVVSQLEMNIEKEFKEKKDIIINGWVLSETEARQCALLSLS